MLLQVQSRHANRRLRPLASPLNVWDFVKIVSLVALDDKTAQAVGPIAATLAQSEKLDAHANAYSEAKPDELQVRSRRTLSPLVDCLTRNVSIKPVRSFEVIMKIRTHLESTPIHPHGPG